MGKKDHYKELNDILSDQNIVDDEKISISENEIAFKNADSFKGVISNNEFASVICLLTNIVEKISDSTKVRNKAKSKAVDKINELKERGIDDKDLSTVVKMIKSELMKTDVKMYESFKNEFDNLNNSIDFLNRFRSHNEMIEKPNLKWLERVKKHINNKKEN